jgi:hypothetical protein
VKYLTIESAFTALGNIHYVKTRLYLGNIHYGKDFTVRRRTAIPSTVKVFFAVRLANVARSLFRATPPGKGRFFAGCQTCFI